MAYTLLIHVANEDAILADIEELPSATDQAIFCTNIRRRDGKDVHYADAQAVSFMIPWHRINFLEVIGGEEEGEIIGFVREKQRISDSLDPLRSH